MSMGLIADIGGTNARFALCDESGNIQKEKTLQCKDYPTINDAITAYLNESTNTPVKAAALAVACPVLSDKVCLTNSHWSFSISELKKSQGFDSIEVVNDFVAQALAIPTLTEKQKVKIGQGEPVSGFPIAVIGPGTGLGVSILIPNADGSYQAIASEGGHATMPAPYPEEERVIALLRQEYGHVSAERVVSGMGLSNLYKTLKALHKENSLELEPAEISKMALEGDKISLEAVQMMFGLLGTLAGNIALTAGALGGVYIAGGIIPRDGLLDMFFNSIFRIRFEAKGRFESYLSKIPTYVMVSDYPAFQGLAGIIQKKLKN